MPSYSYFCPTFSFCFPTFILSIFVIFQVLVFLLFHIAELASLKFTTIAFSFVLEPLNAKVVDSLRTRGHDMQPAKAGATDHVDGVARLNETVYGHADSRGHGNVAFVN